MQLVFVFSWFLLLAVNGILVPWTKKASHHKKRDTELTTQASHFDHCVYGTGASDNLIFTVVYRWYLWNKFVPLVVVQAYLKSCVSSQFVPIYTLYWANIYEIV